MVTAKKKSDKQHKPVNITVVPKDKKKKKPSALRRQKAKTDTQHLEMVRDVLDAHAVGDPDAPLHKRVTGLAMAYQGERDKVLRYIIENADLRAQLRHQTPEVTHAAD